MKGFKVNREKFHFGNFYETRVKHLFKHVEVKYCLVKNINFPPMRAVLLHVPHEMTTVCLYYVLIKNHLQSIFCI